MTERQESGLDQTNRPADGGALPRLRELLALPVVQAGMPEVLVGGPALDAPVRWAHISDRPDAPELLEGGELLLSSGVGWASDPQGQAAFVRGLAEAGAAGVILELGDRFTVVPEPVVVAAREAGLALVVLHRDVMFVALTEVIHNRIISAQTAALRARDEVREQFTALALRGSPADFVVGQLAHTLQAPVVLENLAHEVVVAEIPAALDGELLVDWAARSRSAPVQDTRDDAWLIVPVQARGMRWGRLIALPGPPHPAGRASVLEQGAIALALGCLAGGDAEWTRIGRERLLERLLAGRFTGNADMAARLEAAGLPIGGNRVIGMVAAGPVVAAEAADSAARALGGRALAGSGPAGMSGNATTLLVSLPAPGELTARDARAFAARLAPGADRVVLSIGSAGSGIDDALESLQQATDLARSSDARPAGGIHIRRSADRPLARLITSLRGDRRLLEHSERMLAPLIDYDVTRNGDLLDVLDAMLAHPGNRTAAAAASHLSRSVFYQRIALIQELMGVDLDDGEVQTGLHLALLVRRAVGA